MPRRYIPCVNSELHDPVDRLELLTDEKTRDIYHRGSYYEEWREGLAQERPKKALQEYAQRLSKDPVRRSSQVRWIKSGVDPFDASALLKVALESKDEASRWGAVHDLEKFGLLDATCSAALRKMIQQERREDNQSIALYCLSLIEGPRAERDYIEALESREFRSKFTPMHCIHSHGSEVSVHPVCTFLEKSARKRPSPRSADQWDTDRSYAVRFLDRFLDWHEEVEDVFRAVIRHWQNFDHLESRCIVANARYIGIRVLEPLEPAEDERSNQQEIKMPGFRRRLWKDKSRYRGRFVETEVPDANPKLPPAAGPTVE